MNRAGEAAGAAPVAETARFAEREAEAVAGAEGETPLAVGDRDALAGDLGRWTTWAEDRAGEYHSRTATTAMRRAVRRTKNHFFMTVVAIDHLGFERSARWATRQIAGRGEMAARFDARTKKFR
jgi:LmbE family N-acetylglucosaminyl deacetylase